MSIKFSTIRRGERGDEPLKNIMKLFRKREKNDSAKRDEGKKLLKRCTSSFRYHLIPVLCIVLILFSFLYLSDNQKSNRLLASFKNRYKLGDLVSENVYAPVNISYIDEEKTAELREEITKDASPLFMKSFMQTENNIVKVNAVFDSFTKTREDARNVRARYKLDSIGDDFIKYIFSNTSAWRTTFASLGKEGAKNILENGLFDGKQLNLCKEKGYSKIIVVDSLPTLKNDLVFDHKSIEECYYIEDIDKQIKPFFNEYKGTFNIQEITSAISTIYKLILTPNVEYDKDATNLYIQELKEKVYPVVVRISRGELIIQKDTVVTQNTLNQLEKISKSSSTYSLNQKVMMVVFIAAILVAMYIFFLYAMRKDKRKYLYLNIIYISSAVFIVFTTIAKPWFAFLGISTYDLLIPQFFVPLLVYMLTTKRSLGLGTTIMIAGVLSLFPFSGSYSLIRYFISGVLSVMFLYYSPSKLEKFMNYVLVFVLDQFITLVTLAMEGFAFKSVLLGVFIAAIVFIIGQVLVVLFSLILEKVLNLPTPSRLTELYNHKTPLMEKFEQTCPGSYDHVMAVEKLAEAASDELHFNTPLVKLASLYHDIGKMEHPLYFVENQTEGNKHDDISTELSVAMIRSHVTLGVKMARDAHLPQEVIDIIGQHHGNDTINYFYYEAQRNMETQGGQKEDVNESDYAYRAEPPETREAALVMLADISEAATRSAKKSFRMKNEVLNEEAIHKILNGLFLSKIKNGQLTDSGLTLGDMATIEDVFTTKLVGINHSRIEYKKPDEK